MPTKKKSVRRSAALSEALEDLVVAYRILAMQEVLDAFGHVSIRHPEQPDHYFISRSLAPELVTGADIMKFDLDSNVIGGDDRKPFTERFIHGQLYAARPDVMAIVHSHSPSVVPYGVAGVQLKPVYHMSGFLRQGTPIFNIRTHRRNNDMLIRDNELGVALAKTVGAHCVCLMRGHGNVIVAPDVRLAVFRSIYTEMNARLQLQVKLLGGKAMFLSDDEAAGAEAANIASLERPWKLWKAKAMRAMEQE